MPVFVSGDFLQFDWDISTLEYATPCFEVIEDVKELTMVNEEET